MVKKMKKKVLVASICMILMSTIGFAEELNDILERGFNFNFLTVAPQTINKVSINLLGGYSYGNTGFEFGGLYNINTHLTRGVQLGGLFNYSGNADNAMQFAGITNIATNGMVSSQFGGAVNIARDVRGAQFSGGVNIVGNEVGSQFAGGLNMAKDVGGTQFAGGVNIATEVGSQFGTVNIAKKVNGVQFGLINIADEVDGVAIGLINIVKNGGKYEFELSFSEVLNTAISFKLGTDKFYTIFSGGIKYIPTSSVEYAFGGGFGTHIDWAKGWGNQIELMAHAVTEEGKLSWNRNLYQLKLTVSKEFFKHLKVFAGPTLNLSVSNSKNPQTGELDDSIAPWSMWETTIGGNKLNLWLGFSVGVRF